MSYKTIDGEQTLTVLTREEWRSWLEANHDNFQVMWLVFYKIHTGKSAFTKTDAIDESLCFGWIDSVVRTIDDERYMQRYTPRKQDSIWSEVNKKKVVELEAQGLIHPAGQKLIDHARASGEWDRDRSMPDVVDPPEAFIKALKQHPEANSYWDSLTDKQRKYFALHMTTAKREDTKIRRMEKVIKLLTSKQLPNML